MGVEEMKIGNLEYRPCFPEDLEAIQKRTLKAFFLWYEKLNPVNLVSMRDLKAPLWVAEMKDYDAMRQGYEGILIDITPETRYLIWCKKTQRFCTFKGQYGDVVADWYMTEVEAQIAI